MLPSDVMRVDGVEAVEVTHAVSGQIVEYSPIREEVTRWQQGKRPAVDVYTYTRDFAIRVCGNEGRIVQVFRDGVPVAMGATNLHVRNGTLYGYDYDVTDTAGRIPDFTFHVVRR